MAVASATAIVVRVRTAAIRPASAFGSTARLNITVPSAFGHVPERLGQAARDRIDPGLPRTPRMMLIEEGVRAELEPLRERSRERPGPEPELLGEERRMAARPDDPVRRGDPHDHARGHHERDEVEHERDVQAEPGDRRRRDDHHQEDPAPDDPDDAVRDDPLAPEQREQAEPEEQLARDGHRGEQELRPGQVRDERRERPRWPDRRSVRRRATGRRGPRRRRRPPSR